MDEDQKFWSLLASIEGGVKIAFGASIDESVA